MHWNRTSTINTWQSFISEAIENLTKSDNLVLFERKRRTHVQTLRAIRSRARSWRLRRHFYYASWAACSCSRIEPSIVHRHNSFHLLLRSLKNTNEKYIDWILKMLRRLSNKYERIIVFFSLSVIFRQFIGKFVYFSALLLLSVVATTATRRARNTLDALLHIYFGHWIVLNRSIFFIFTFRERAHTQEKSLRPASVCW